MIAMNEYEHAVTFHMHKHPAQQPLIDLFNELIAVYEDDEYQLIQEFAGDRVAADVDSKAKIDAYRKRFQDLVTEIFE